MKHRDSQPYSISIRLASTAATLLICLGACTTGQAPAESSTSAVPARPDTSTTSIVTSTTIAVFDQETADAIMAERFGTSTTHVATFVPNDPTDEETELLVLMANTTLSDTRFSIEDMGADAWGAMLRDGSLAACESLFQGSSEAHALGAALSRAADVNLVELGEGFDPDAYLLAVVYLSRGMQTYCPDLWTLDSSDSEAGAQQIQAIWDELTGVRPPGDTDIDTEEVSDSERVRQALISDLEKGEFERVELVRFADGEILIEGRLLWASQDRQRPSHFAVVELIAESFAEVSEATRALLFGTATPKLVMRTTSTDGDYAVSSITSWDLLQRINNREASSTDWWDEAGQ